MLIRTIEDKAEYIECVNKLYHAGWMRPITTESYSYTRAVILEINEEEYNILIPASENSPIIIDDIEEPIIPEIINPSDLITLEYVKESKINEMSRTCNQVIEAGFDIELGGKVEHFSLTTQDQLNLISLSSMAANGMEAIPYHADGEICRFYSNAEMQAIVARATAFKIYHTTYFNALKNYINSLDTIEAIAAITYGVELPEAYQSDVLKSLQQ